MKNWIFLFLAGVLTVSGCQLDKPLKSRATVVMGTLADSDATTISLVRAEDHFAFKRFLSAQDTCQLDSTGLFALRATLNNSGFFYVCAENGYPLLPPLWLSPGDTLLVNGKKEDSQTINYEGPCGAVYSFFTEWYQILKLDSSQQKKYDRVFAMQPDTFLQYIRDRMEKGEKALATYSTGAQTCLPMEELANRYMNYDVGNLFFKYLQYHNYYANDTFLYYAADSTFYSILQNIPTHPDSFFFLIPCNQYVEGKLTDLYEKSFQNLPDSVRYANELSLKLQLIREHFSGLERDLALLSLANGFSFALSNPDFFDHAEAIKVFFQKNAVNQVNYQKYLTLLASFENLRPGAPAPTLQLPDIQGNTRALEEMTGKVVYLDFWGTWCYPCLQEMPHSLQLQKKFEGKAVEFVFVALEYGAEDIERWKKFVLGEEALSYAPFLEKMAWPGVHLLSEKQFNNPALKPWLINYAPTYVLIDKTGSIVRGRAPRPSDPEIETLLTDLLSE